VLPVVERLRHLRALVGGAHPAQTDIDADPVQPRPERRLTTEAMQPPIRTKKRVLRQVACVFVIADKPETQPIHRSAVALDHQIEGACPAGEARLNQRGFAQIGERRFSRR
jgi:hypothetical protein